MTSELWSETKQQHHRTLVVTSELWSIVTSELWSEVTSELWSETKQQHRTLVVTSSLRFLLASLAHL